MDSDFEESTNLISSPEESSHLEPSLVNSSNLFEDNSINSDTIHSIYNKEDYKLEDDKTSRIYIFRHNLFTRHLLPINPNKHREMRVQCTRLVILNLLIIIKLIYNFSCNFYTECKIKGFQASNLSRHYQAKHPAIAYNKKSEKIRKRSMLFYFYYNYYFTNNFIEADVIPLTNNALFNLNEQNKRVKSSSLLNFNKEKALNKILIFQIENNISFNAIASNSFNELLSYYNK